MAFGTKYATEAARRIDMRAGLDRSSGRHRSMCRAIQAAVKVFVPIIRNLPIGETDKS